MTKKKHVVIIGGGLAGLSTAESLLRQAADQFDVTILESKRVTGGRAGSFTDPASGEQIDYCQHVAMGCCTNLLGLIDRYGLSDRLQKYQQLEFLHPDFPPSQFAPNANLPAPLHLASVIGELKFLTWAQHRSIRRAMLGLMRTKTESLRDTTAIDWLRKNRQDSDTIRRFWDVILVSALGESTDHVSMAAARKVMIDGFAAAKGASDVLVPKEPLASLFGDRLTQAIAGLGAEIKTGQAVRKIESDPVGLRLQDDQLLTADHVVCAVPWHQLGSLLTEQHRQAIDHFDTIGSIPSSPITGIHLWFDRPITDQPHHVFVDTTIQWLFRDPTNQEMQADEHYYQVVISASRDIGSVTKSELIDRVHSELRRAFPSTASARLLRSQIVTDPRSVFSVRPEVEAIRPPSRTALPWLHLAGDWTATGWPATMEGAVISGIQASGSILKSCDLTYATPDAGIPRTWLSKLLIKP